MKNQIKKLVITTCFALVNGIAIAQVSLFNNVPQPPVGAPALLLPTPSDITKRHPEPDEMLKMLTTLTGKITSYLTNDRYIYNTFTLQNGNQLETVRFPEHLGQTLMNTAKKGESIIVKGFKDQGPDGVISFQLVSAIANGNQIFDTPPAAPAQPVSFITKTYTGSISDFKKDDHGNINGINIDNKILVSLPPQAVSQLQLLIKTGDKIEVSGFKDTPPSGVVLAANAPATVHPQTITINGQTYLLR